MPWGVAAAVGGAVVSGAFSANAASTAADAQKQASQDTQAFDAQQYNANKANFQGYLDSGNTANNALSYYMGLGGGVPGAAAPQYLTEQQIRDQLTPQYTKQGSSNTPSVSDLSAADQAQLARADSVTYGINPQTGQPGFQAQYTVSGGDAGTSSQSQWFAAPAGSGGSSSGGVDQAGLDAAVQAQLAQQTQQQQTASTDPRYGSLLSQYKAYTPYGDYQPFTSADLPTDDGYQFRLTQGTDALQHSAAAAGGLNSGRALQALSDYSQQSASQEYNQAAARHATDYTTGLAGHESDYNTGANAFNTSQTNTYNKLAAQAGVGQTAASSLAGVSNSYTGQVNSAINGAANASAAQTVASTNAANQGVGQVTNALTGYINSPTGVNTSGAAFTPSVGSLYYPSGQSF